MEQLRNLRPHLTSWIKGQDHVLDRVCSVLTRGQLGFAHPRRPKGSLLFIGPSGVGKTETSKVFTHYLFEGAAPVRFDMSEYQLQKSVDKLIGESREDGGLLGRALRGVTHGTLLFDEIEKAHALVLDLFLQMLEDARITLATGEVLDLAGFYIVFTSNIGSAEVMRMVSAPFSTIERTVLMRVGQELRPELVGRLTEKLVFARLDYATQREICEQLTRSDFQGVAIRLFRRLTGSNPVIDFSIMTNKTATVADLRNHFRRVSAWLENGESVEIIKRGRRFARLVPVAAAPHKLVKIDFARQLCSVWGHKAFSDAAVREMREAESGSQS